MVVAQDPCGHGGFHLSVAVAEARCRRVCVVGLSSLVTVAAMSRGIVLWPDRASEIVIRGMWDELAARGLPSQATYTHRLHQPHVSLTVAEHLPADETVRVVGTVPSEPIRLLVEAVCVFPGRRPGAPGGGVVLACVANDALLAEQRRVHAAVAALATDPWPRFAAGTWTPHITMARDLQPDQIARALPVLLDRLPIEGWLDHGGVEDGTSGENWPAPAPTWPAPG